MHFSTSDKSDSAYKVLSQALKGIVSSQYELGLILEEAHDMELAGAWYKKAAMQGHSDAAFRAGMLCLKLPGDNQSEAAYWLQRAANVGHAEAQYNLALIYETGRGVRLDPEEALRWHRIAARQGHPHARAKLDQLNNWFDTPVVGS